MPLVPTVPLQPLLPTVLVLAPLLRTRDRRVGILVHRLAVFTQVAAVAVAVAAEAAPERLLVRVRALVRAERRLHAERFGAAWVVACERFAARVCC